MDVKEFLDVLFQAILVGVVPVAVAAGRKLINAKVKEITDKMEDRRVTKLIQDAKDLIGEVVEETTQTYVDNMKGQSMFDEEAQKVAFDKSYNKAKALMYEEMQEAVEIKYADFDKWLVTQIEAATRRAKSSAMISTDLTIEE